VRVLLIAGIALIVLWTLVVIALALLGRRSIARELVSLIPNIVRLFRGLVGDPRVPRPSKALLWLGAAWLASPIDLIPEFLPGIGALDDAIVAGLVLRHLVKRAGPEIVRDHWRGDPRTLGLLFRAIRISPA
jgi:uncharacterized membrane protein YkvA (DUF1232 family)